MVFSQSNNNLNSSSRADKVAQSDTKVCGKTAKYPYSKAIGDEGISTTGYVYPLREAMAQALRSACRRQRLHERPKQFWRKFYNG
ncbi:MAG: hypothetical protein HEQ35_20385 [Gloeotrichia echinulata IR180]